MDDHHEHIGSVLFNQIINQTKALINEGAFNETIGMLKASHVRNWIRANSVGILGVKKCLLYVDRDNELVGVFLLDASNEQIYRNGKRLAVVFRCKNILTKHFSMDDELCNLFGAGNRTVIINL